VYFIARPEQAGRTDFAGSDSPPNWRLWPDVIARSLDIAPYLSTALNSNGPLSMWLRSVALPAVLSATLPIVVGLQLIRVIGLQPQLVAVRYVLVAILSLWTGWRVARSPARAALGAALGGAATASASLLPGAAYFALALSYGASFGLVLRPLATALLGLLVAGAALGLLGEWLAARVRHRQSVG
jgi:hypothetical protein